MHNIISCYRKGPAYGTIIPKLYLLLHWHLLSMVFIFLSDFWQVGIIKTSYCFLQHHVEFCRMNKTILVPGYIFHMWNDQMSGSKAGNTWKGFQNNKYKIDTKGTELFAYYDTQLWHNRSCDQERSIKASKLAWSGETFFIRLHLKKLIHTWYFT